MKSKKREIDLAGKQNLSRIGLVRGLRMQHRCSIVMSNAGVGQRKAHDRFSRNLLA